MSDILSPTALCWASVLLHRHSIWLTWSIHCVSVLHRMATFWEHVGRTAGIHILLFQ